MKQIKSLMFIAAAAMAFTGCSKDNAEVPTPEVPQTIIKVVAEGNGTRTAIDADGNISWNATGEDLYVYELAGTETSPTFRYTNEAYTLGIDGSATFTVAFDTKTATSFLYGAIYPKAAYITGSNTDLNAIKFGVPQMQSPLANTYDPKADVLVAKPQTTTAQPTTGVSFTFGRAIALGKMSVKNLALTSGEFIKNVIFTAPTKVVTGRGKVDLKLGKPATEWGYSDAYKFDNVQMNYEDNVLTNKTFDAWFTCAPFALAAAEKFSVTVTTDKGTYVREVTLGEGKTLTFTVGQLSNFGVDMTGATFTPTVVDTSIFSIPFGDGTVTTEVTYDAAYNMNTTGTATAGLAYAFSATSKQIRNNSNVFADSDYVGASGKSFWWGAAGTFTISNITLGNDLNFALSFGGKASQGASTATVEISKDGTTFFPLATSDVALEVKANGNMLKTLNFHFAGAVSEKATIRITTGANAIIDDVKLTALETIAEGSLLIDFLTAPSLATTPSNGGTLSFAANAGTDGVAPASQEIIYTWDGANCTFEATKATADTWYTLTYDATVKNGAITIAPTANTSATDTRTGTVTMKVIKTGEAAITQTVTIEQRPNAAGEQVIYTTGFEVSEGFKAGTNYQSTTTTGESGKEWKTYYGTPATSSALTSSQSMQMRYYSSTPSHPYTQTEFNLGKVTKVEFSAAASKIDANNLTVYYSTDNGTTWTACADYPKTLTTSKASYTATVSTTGEFENVRLKFEFGGPKPASGNNNLRIDDVAVYGM